MIVAIIIASVLILILIALLIPLKLELLFSDDFKFKLKYAGIKILPKQKRKLDKKSDKADTQEKEKDNFVKKLFDENDFPTFIKIMLDFLKTVFSQLKFIVRHIKVKKLSVDIIVASTDAAVTAISYGVVCTAFYNALKFAETLTKIKIKKINISSDFEKAKSSLGFGAEISISPLFLLISAVVVMKKYIEFTNREGSVNNERK